MDSRRILCGKQWGVNGTLRYGIGRIKIKEDDFLILKYTLKFLNKYLGAVKFR